MERADPYDSPLSHRDGDECVVSLVPIPNKPDDRVGKSADEEPDHHGRIPGVLVAAVLECEQEHGDGRGEEGEAHQVEEVRQPADDLGDRLLGHLLVDVDDEEGHHDDCAQGQVDVEAPPHLQV